MDLSCFDLNLLRVLDALLRDGSTVKAGARIGLSQPAVSAALGRLRHTLNDDLFLRQGTGLVPTDFARSLELPLQKVFSDLEAALSNAKAFDPATGHQTFRISGSDFYAECLLPQLARQVSLMAPGMRLQFIGLVPDLSLETLVRHGIDIALVPESPLHGWADCVPTITSGFKVIARKDHPGIAEAGLKAGEVMPIDLYCRLGHVIFSSEGNFVGVGEEALKKIDRERKVVLSLPFFSGVYRAVSESDLIALFPHQLAERVAGPAGLVCYEPPMPITPIRSSMIWHKRSTTSPAHKWLRELISGLLARWDLSEAE